MKKCLNVLLFATCLMIIMTAMVSAQGYGPPGTGCCNTNKLAWYPAGTKVGSGCVCQGKNVWKSPNGETFAGAAYCNGSPNYALPTPTQAPRSAYADGQLWYENGVATQVFRTACNCWEPIQHAQPTVRVAVCVSPKTVQAAPARGDCDGQVIIVPGVGKYQWVASFDSWTILEQYQVPTTITRPTRQPTITPVPTYTPQRWATATKVFPPTPTLTATAAPAKEPFSLSSLIPKFLRGSEEQPRSMDTPRSTNTPKPTQSPKPSETTKPTQTPKPTNTPKPTSTPGIEMLSPVKWPDPDPVRCISPVGAYPLPVKGQCNGQVVGLRVVVHGGTVFPNYQWNEKDGEWEELEFFEHPKPFDRPLTENEVHVGSILAILAVTGLGATGAAGTGFLAYKAIPLIVNTRKRRKEREEQYDRARRCFEAGDFVSCEKLLRPLAESGSAQAKQLLNEALWLQLYHEAKQYLAEMDFGAAVESLQRLQIRGGATEEIGRMLAEALEGQKLHGLCARAAKLFAERRINQALEVIAQVPCGFRDHVYDADVLRAEITAYKAQEAEDFERLMAQAQEAAGRNDWQAAMQAGQAAAQSHPDLFTSELAALVGSWEEIVVNEEACAQATVLAADQRWTEALEAMRHVPAGWHGAYSGDDIRQRIETERRQDFGQLMSQAHSAVAQFNWSAAIESARAAQSRHPDLFTPDLRDTLRTWETALVNDTACMRALELIDKQQWTEALQTLANVPAGWHQAYSGDELRQRVERERAKLFGELMARANAASGRFEWEEALRTAREARTLFPDLFGTDQHRLIVTLEDNLRHEQSCTEALKLIEAKKWAEAREVMRDVPVGWSGVHHANEIVQTLNRVTVQLFGEAMSTAFVAAQNNDYDKAIREAKKAKKKYPSLFDSQCEAQVNAWWQAKSYDEACARATIRVKAGEWKKAQDELKKVPSDWDAAQALRGQIKAAFDAQAEAKRQTEAEAAYTKVIGDGNYFQVLGVSPNDDDDAVKAAYRRFARQWHPDLNSGNATAEGRFKAINEANEALKTADKRRKHQQMLEQRRQDEQKAADLKARAAAFKNNRRGHHV